MKNAIIDVIESSSDISKCDAIVLSVVTNRRKISRMLSKRTNIPIISIVDIVEELCNKLRR